tara:strand:- start:52 stop:291 length:240 start_codon:yes stop_codon:yes gene_type:complete
MPIVIGTMLICLVVPFLMMRPMLHKEAGQEILYGLLEVHVFLVAYLAQTRMVQFLIDVVVLQLVDVVISRSQTVPQVVN